MWFRLAALWGCTVREAQKRCSSREFAEWMAYYRLEPWGEWRADYRNGLALSTYLNTKLPKGKRVKPDDFMPNFGPPRRASAKELASKLEMLAKVTQARDLRK